MLVLLSSPHPPNESAQLPFCLDKASKKIGHYIAIEKGKQQLSLDDQKPNLGSVCIGDGYFYSNIPASIRQALINSHMEVINDE